MLNRRHLRIKIIHALYAFFQSKKDEQVIAEKELIHSVNKTYDLYLSMLLLLVDIRHFAELKLEEAKSKRLPSEEDLNPNTRFIDNRVLDLLAVNKQLQKNAQDRGISWTNHQDFIKKLFLELKETEEYIEYMNLPNVGFEEDRQVTLKLFKRHIANFDLLHHHIEESSIYWSDDLDHVASMVIKTVKLFQLDSDEYLDILPKFKDPMDEPDFMHVLFNRAIRRNEELDSVVKENVKNWELERIALMDMILIKLALTEAIEFPNIPTKVTMNEYIELSKYYSTPKSNVFINGILDKVFAEFTKSGKIKKTGRGLIS